jgi:hypothetical protein
MDRALSLPLPQPARTRSVNANRPYARLLTPNDLPVLMELEHEKWEVRQAASQADLLARIEAYPELALGAFCSRTGRLLASLFLKPVPDDFAQHADTWQDCVDAHAPSESTALFGISLSSRDAAGVTALFAFFWPRALKRGWRHVYLGSPVPGLRAWLKRNPQGRVEDYVHARRAGRPLDPQLRYYRGRGFGKIVGVMPGYFPHERSLDYGVLLRGTIPLSTLAPIWRRLPMKWISRVTMPLVDML